MNLDPNNTYRNAMYVTQVMLAQGELDYTFEGSGFFQKNRETESQEIIGKFDTKFRRICYIIDNISKNLYHLEKTEGNYMLTWNSGVIYFYHLIFP